MTEVLGSLNLNRSNWVSDSIPQFPNSEKGKPGSFKSSERFRPEMILNLDTLYWFISGECQLSGITTTLLC